MPNNEKMNTYSEKGTQVDVGDIAALKREWPTLYSWLRRYATAPDAVLPLFVGNLNTFLKEGVGQEFCVMQPENGVIDIQTHAITTAHAGSGVPRSGTR